VIGFPIIELLLLVSVIVILTALSIWLYKKVRAQHDWSARKHEALEQKYARDINFAQTRSHEISQGKQRSEARFRLLLDSTAEGIYGLDMNGNFTFVNKAALRMLGYQHEEELLQKNAHLTVRHTKPDGTEYKPLESGIFSAQLAGQQFHRDVELLWTKTGRALPVELSLYPMYEGEEICGSVVTFIDITESLRVEAERTAIELKFQHLMDSSSDVVFVGDYQGRLQYFNQAALTMLGYTRSELLNISFFDLVPFEWRDTYRKKFAELISHKKQLLMEVRLLRKDSTHAALELSANSVFEDGLVYGAFRDISQRKEAEKKMKLMVDRLSLATSAAKLGVVDFNIADNLLSFDRRGCELHGFPVQDEYLIGYAGYQKTLHPEDRDRVHNEVRKAVAERSDAYLQFRVLLPTGQVRNIESFVKVTLDKNGMATRMLGVCSDNTQQKMDEYEINLLAFYDPLTKLPNRRLLLDRLKHALAVSSHAQAYGAVLFLDLDHFKILNDTRGHDVGDLLLLEVAARLQACLREGDSVARLGGDEFVVILESLSTQEKFAMQQTELVGEKICGLLAQPYELDGYQYQTSSSIGISLFIGHSESVDDLLKHADSAMYQAKAAGRGVCRFFDPVMQNALEQRALLEDDLRRAIERQGELELHYQIQMDYLDRVIGAELLLRWNHPERGMILPNEFITLAEETGLIGPIGDWILKCAVVQLKVWQDHPLLSQLTLAVNVSVKQFRRDDFVEKIRRLLLVSCVRPEMLKLELTESLMLENVTDTIAKMQTLRKIGVRFSLDDFGMGYSSLAYLKQLPIDQIKIDQSFVRDIATDPNDAAIVVTIIAMSKALGLNVLAEGVETAAQRNFLEAKGCYAFQGYLFGKPVPLSKFEKLVTEIVSHQLVKH